MNGRILEARQDGWFWDSQITPELTGCILSLKDGEGIDLKTKDTALCVVREGKRFFIESEEYNERFEILCKDFILWQSDLEKITSSLRRKPTKETFYTAVSAPLYKKIEAQ